MQSPDGDVRFYEEAREIASHGHAARMIRVDIHRFIDVPIEEVFDRLRNIDEYSNWLARSAIFIDSGVDSDAEEVGVGTVFHDESTLGRLIGEVTEFEPPHRIAFRQELRKCGRSVFESRPEYLLESENGGTSVHHFGEAELMRPLGFAEPIVFVLAQYERRRVMRALKASLE